MNYNEAKLISKISDERNAEGGLSAAVQRIDSKRKAENAFGQAVCSAKLL